MDNLKIYNKMRNVPANALKTIAGGRLKGMSDINPMWRIKTLTETFGPCGIGWMYQISDKRLEPGPSGEIAAFVDIDLYIRHEGKWSDAIPGTGGSMFVAKEKAGLYTSDECYKMALTDAIGVACKALGVAADVYWDKDRTKYNNQSEVAGAKKESDTITKEQAGKLFEIANRNVDLVQRVAKEYGYSRSMEIKKEHYPKICDKIVIMAREHGQA